MSTVTQYIVLSDNKTFERIDGCKILFTVEEDNDSAPENAHEIFDYKKVSLSELVRFWEENHK